MLIDIEEPHVLDETATQGAVIGIDLGTTHCAAAYIDANGAPHLIPIFGENLVPSIITVQNGVCYVGKDAPACDKTDVQIHLKEPAPQSASSNTHVFRSTKRFFDAPTTPIRERENSHEYAACALTPQEAAVHLLRYMKKGAETFLAGVVRGAVITVPAYFDDVARAATKRAAEDAGLRVLRLIAEPTAAAFAYGLEKAAQNNEKSGVYAVFDFGGGTFDVSLLNMQEGVFQVLATGGDTQLGGDDIDRAIQAHLDLDTLEEAKAIKETGGHAVPSSYAKNSNDGAKKHASMEKSPHDHALTERTLEEIARPFITRTLEICHNVLLDAQKTIHDVDGVILVGGSTRLAAVQKAVAAFFKQAPLKDVHPDEVVALGAAHHAHHLTQGSEYLLLDVTPLSLGVETMGGLMEVIIPRNTPLPCHMGQDFTTAIDHQQHLKIHIYQGERDTVRDCRSLGEFILSDIPPMKAHTARIRVTFALDMDGLLSVTATEFSSGASKALKVNALANLDHDTIVKTLEEGQLHDGVDMVVRLLTKQMGEAEVILHGLKKMACSSKAHVMQTVSALEEALHAAQVSMDHLESQGTKSDGQTKEALHAAQVSMDHLESQGTESDGQAKEAALLQHQQKLFHRYQTLRAVCENAYNLLDQV